MRIGGKTRIGALLTATAMIGASVLALGANVAPAGASEDHTVDISPAGGLNEALPSISADGRYVAYISDAVHISDVGNLNVNEAYVYDRQTGDRTMVSVNNDGGAADEDVSDVRISADGNDVVFTTQATNMPGSNYTTPNVYERDLAHGATTSITESNYVLAADGIAISGDGSTVAFTCYCGPTIAGSEPPIGQIEVMVARGGAISFGSSDSFGDESTGYAYQPSLSATGRYLAFAAANSNLDPSNNDGLTDVYRKDLQTGDVTLVSSTLDGSTPTNYSDGPSISGDGNYVAFESLAQNIVDMPSPYSIGQHVYRRDIAAGTTEFADETSAGVQFGFGASFDPAISEDGRYVTFRAQGPFLTELGELGGVVNDLKDFATGVLETTSVGESTGLPIDNVSGRSGVANDGTVTFINDGRLDGGGYDDDVYVRTQGPAATQPAVLTISPDVTHPHVGQIVTFSLTADAPNAQVIDYSFDQGDGGPHLDGYVTPTSDDHHAYRQYAYSAPGTYHVTASMLDDDNRVTTATYSITVSAPNQSPTAQLSATPLSGLAPLTVHLDAGGSHDNDGSITSYDFAFSDASPDVTGTSPTTDHTFTTPGNYTVFVTVTDNDGAQSSAQAYITVTAPPITSIKGALKFPGMTGKGTFTVTPSITRNKKTGVYKGAISYADAKAKVSARCVLTGTVTRTPVNGATFSATCTGRGPQKGLTGTASVTLYDTSSVHSGQQDEAFISVGGTLNFSYGGSTANSKLVIAPVDPTSGGVVSE